MRPLYNQIITGSYGIKIKLQTYAKLAMPLHQTKYRDRVCLSFYEGTQARTGP